MKTFTTVLCTLLCVVFVLAIIFFGFTPDGREVWHSYTHSLNKADEVSYETRKLVEDTARTQIASYEADVALYRAYKDAEDVNMRQYGETAKMRAIRTATIYNEFLIKNSYVWRDNIPADIYEKLDVNIE